MAKWLRGNSFGCKVACSQSKHTEASKWLWRGNIVSSSLQWLRRSFRAAISSAQWCEPVHIHARNCLKKISGARS